LVDFALQIDTIPQVDLVVKEGIDEEVWSTFEYAGPLVSFVPQFDNNRQIDSNRNIIKERSLFSKAIKYQSETLQSFKTVSIGPVKVITADVRLNSVQVVAVSELVVELKRYFDEFSVMQNQIAKREVIQEGAEQPNPAKDDGPLSLNLIKMNVRIENCVLLAPLDREETTKRPPIVALAQFNMGTISVSNEVYATIYTPSPEITYVIPWDKMTVHVGALALQTHFPHPDHHMGLKQDHLLWDTNIDVVLVRSLITLDGLNEVEGGVVAVLPPPMSVFVNIPKIEVTLSEFQIHFLLSVMVDSLNEMQKMNSEDSSNAPKDSTLTTTEVARSSQLSNNEKKTLSVIDSSAAMDMHVHLGVFSILLSETNASPTTQTTTFHIKNDFQTNPVVSFASEGLNVHMTTGKSSWLEMGVGMTSMHLKECRDITAFPHLLSPGKVEGQIESQSDMIEMRFRKEDNVLWEELALSKMDIQVNVIAPEV
jgi:hypothetical protein